MSQDLLRSCLKLNKRTLNPQKTPRHNTQPDNVEEDHREAGAEKTRLHLACALPSQRSLLMEMSSRAAPGQHQARLQTKGFGQKEVA